MTSIKSTLRTAPEFCKNVFSTAVLFGNKCNSLKVSTQSDMCIYTYYSQHTDASWAKEIKFGVALNAVFHGNISAHRRFASLPERFRFKYTVFRDTNTMENTTYIHINYTALKCVGQIFVRYSGQISVYNKL